MTVNTRPRPDDTWTSLLEMVFPGSEIRAPSRIHRGSKAGAICFSPRRLLAALRGNDHG
jgi:hypothetical protein